MTGAALLVVDLQNDFLHTDGAYARGGATSPALTAVVGPAVRLCDAARSGGVPIAASRFTLWPGRGGAPIIDAHLAGLRPFLGGSDFAPGSWGQSTLAELDTPDAAIDKVAYSAFAHTRLGWWLDRMGVTEVAVCGIVTNGGVASTVHDAHVRGYRVSVVADACAAFDADLHEATLRSLGSIASLTTVDELVAAWA